MTLDLEQFACRILEGETSEEVQETIAAARADYDADIRASLDGIWQCTGCGHVTRALARDLRILQASGARSCCPERDMKLAADIRNGGAS